MVESNRRQEQAKSNQDSTRNEPRNRHPGRPPSNPTTAQGAHRTLPDPRSVCSFREAILVHTPKPRGRNPPPPNPPCLAFRSLIPFHPMPSRPISSRHITSHPIASLPFPSHPNTSPRTLLYLLVELGLVVVVERGVTPQQDVCNYPDAPDVHGLAVELSLQDLRRHVPIERRTVPPKYSARWRGVAMVAA